MSLKSFLQNGEQVKSSRSAGTGFQVVSRAGVREGTLAELRACAAEKINSPLSNQIVDHYMHRADGLRLHAAVNHIDWDLTW
jgi:hypothetical protein